MASLDTITDTNYFPIRFESSSLPMIPLERPQTQTQHQGTPENTREHLWTPLNTFVKVTFTFIHWKIGINRSKGHHVGAYVVFVSNKQFDYAVWCLLPLPLLPLSSSLLKFHFRSLFSMNFNSQKKKNEKKLQFYFSPNF